MQLGLLFVCLLKEVDFYGAQSKFFGLKTEKKSNHISFFPEMCGSGFPQETGAFSRIEMPPSKARAVS